MVHIDYYLVIDFECTCEEVRRTDFHHEIIEFPCVLVDAKKREIVATFREYVRPVENPKLSKFCTKLTGITQDKVDEADILEDVINHFFNWAKSYGIFGEKNGLFCTDGPWDMECFLFRVCKFIISKKRILINYNYKKECHRKGINFPTYFQKWVDVRHYFKIYTGNERRKNIAGMLAGK